MASTITMLTIGYIILTCHATGIHRMGCNSIILCEGYKNNRKIVDSKVKLRIVNWHNFAWLATVEAPSCQPHAIRPPMNFAFMASLYHNRNMTYSSMRLCTISMLLIMVHGSHVWTLIYWVTCCLVCRIQCHNLLLDQLMHAFTKITSPDRFSPYIGWGKGSDATPIAAYFWAIPK